MAGLNNTLSDTQQTSTTMPAWYDQAQQNIVGQGTAAAAAAPSFGQTTAQGAVNTLQGANNPFTQAQGTLQQISSGAANPWITDQTTGAVTPNTGTAMGGLFAAQQQELNQFMPEYGAGAEAGAIGSGGFGGLRGQTAVEKARGDAFAKLNAAQMQAALTNQQTGSSAAANLGNVGQQGISAGMNVGQAQQNAPFNTVSNYANLLGSLQAPTTTTQQVQLSPLSQAATLANTLQGTGAMGGLSSLFFGNAASGTKAASKGIFGTGGLGSVLGGAGTDLWKYMQGIGSNSTGTFPLDGGGELTINNDGSQYIKDANGVGTYYDASGNPMTEGINSGEPAPDIGDGSMPTNPDNSIDYSGDNWGEG
jgi:hypothetical protein